MQQQQILLTAYAPGTVLGPREGTVNKNKVIMFMVISSSWEDSKQICDEMSGSDKWYEEN